MNSRPRSGVAPRLLVMVLVALAVFVWRGAPGATQTTARVGLVVDLGDGTLITRVITLSEENPTGYQVLQASGLDLVATTSGMGVAVCSIAGTGCPSTNCFCGAPTNNWSYWHLEQQEWRYSPAGASTFRVSDGAVEGWSWGAGVPPPVLSFDEIVARAAEIGPAPQAGAQQEYPLPEQPVLGTPFPTYDPYPGLDVVPTVVIDAPYPGPDTGAPTAAIGTPDPYPIVSPLTTATLPALRPTFTPDPAGGALPGTSPPPGLTATSLPLTPSVTLAPGALATVTVLPTGTLVEGTPTADRVAILISTAVARDKTDALAASGEHSPERSRSYGGFAFLVAVLLAAIGYVYLLQRQRRARAITLPNRHRDV